MLEVISTPPSPSQRLQTHLLTYPDLSSNPALTSHLAEFINICFHNSHARFPDSWSTDRKRFESNQEFLDMVGVRGVFCVVYDEDDNDNATGSKDSNSDSESESGGGGGAGAGGEVRAQNTAHETATSRSKRIIACAGAIPWNMGAKDTTVAAPANAPKEYGWEIKTVCVDAGARYAKTGLAGRMEDVLARYLLQLEKAEKVTLWIIASEELRGSYWRRRGYTDVRSGVAEVGTWGCKVPFKMICLKKDVKLGLPA